MIAVPLQVVLWTILGLALAISVITDLLQRRILDVVTYPSLALVLIVRLGWEGVGGLERGLLSGLVGGVGASALFAVLAMRGRGFGWGDVKLMGVAGAAVGYPLVLAVLVFVSLVGALQAVVTLIWHGSVWETLAGAVRRWAVRVRLRSGEGPNLPRRQIPYGLAIAVGSVWAMWWEHTRT